MDKNIDAVEFTIFDTETTGLEPGSGDRIIEIAGIRFKGKEKLSVFQALVNPHHPVSEGAFNVNRITVDMLKDAPEINAVLPKFLDFISGSCLCSYNASFDLGFLNNELKLIHKSLPQDTAVIDILKMAKWLLPRLNRYALWFVAESLGVRAAQEHRALSDAELTLAVFNKLKEILNKKGISDFIKFLSLFGLNCSLLNDINSQKVAKIEEAIGLGVKLNIKYLSRSNAEVTERNVVPKEIKEEKSQQYLVGHCCLRNEERSFRIDGILHIEII